jgi:hypothetical protein
MSYWVRLPTKWIRDRKLDDFKLRGGAVLELKIYFALLILKGRYQRRMRSEQESFPATLDDISATAHVSRPHAAKGVQLLRERKRIEAGRREWRKAGVGHRTTFHRLRGKKEPFFKFPWELVAISKLLEHLRLNNRNTLQALKVYLLLAAFSNNTSGVARMGYATMGLYGLNRNAIRAGVHLLIEANLISVAPSEMTGESNVYIVRGISKTKPSLPSEESKPLPAKPTKQQKQTKKANTSPPNVKVPF